MSEYLMQNAMERISFGWSQEGSLAFELSQPIYRLSVHSSFPFSGVEYVTLLRADGSTIVLSNHMHDIAERLEVGILDFRKEDTPIVDDLIKETVDLDPSYQQPFRLSKLVIEESGIQAESGIEMVTANGTTIVIVAGGMPCTLEVQGVKVAAALRGPEYPLDMYQREIIDIPS